MQNVAKAEYRDLVDVWWKTAKALDAMPPTSQTKSSWHAHVFERILVQCGWTVREWNDYVEAEKKAKVNK